MSQQLISHNQDLKRLQDEGYNVVIHGGHLVLRGVPYVDGNREVKLGNLVCALDLAGDQTVRPKTHVMMLAGDYPCDAEGKPIEKIRHGSQIKDLGGGLVVNHSFSSKPKSGGYADFYEKMTTYAAILTTPAQQLDPKANPKTFPVIEAGEEESVFRYLDTASSRAGITAVSQKLRIGPVAIVGLGGTGSYVMDLVAKTPVSEIRLFDPDTFLQHNAFRSPGAASIEVLRGQPKKVDYLADIYSNIRRKIVAHPVALGAENVDLLGGVEFVFLCMDASPSKKEIIDYLVAKGIAFVDAGLGVDLREDGSLAGVVRVTTGSPGNYSHLSNRISFGQAGGNEYSTNIQVADLNALNATLLVIRWKKMIGFYADLEREHNCAYTIDGNVIANNDHE